MICGFGVTSTVTLSVTVFEHGLSTVIVASSTTVELSVAGWYIGVKVLPPDIIKPVPLVICQLIVS